MLHRPLDPRKVNVLVDANAFNRDGTDKDRLVDRVLKLIGDGEIIVVAPHGVRNEVQDSGSPTQVQQAFASQLFTISTDLIRQERHSRLEIEAGLQGNAKPGKHAADASHLFEAAKYGGYFITHDERILKRAASSCDLPPSLTVVTLMRFLDIFDDYQKKDLRLSDRANESSNEEDWTIKRSRQKARAVEDIKRALVAVSSARRKPDQWEQECLVHAIGALFRGLYPLASANVEKAYTPREQRAYPLRDRSTHYDLDFLQRAFVAAEAEPVRQFPHFGPIVFK